MLQISSEGSVDCTRFRVKSDVWLGEAGGEGGDADVSDVEYEEVDDKDGK